jgi:hypothetical protein
MASWGHDHDYSRRQLLARQVIAASRVVRGVRRDNLADAFRRGLRASNQYAGTRRAPQRERSRNKQRQERNPAGPTLAAYHDRQEAVRELCGRGWWRRWRAERHYKREPRSGCGRGLEFRGFHALKGITDPRCNCATVFKSFSWGDPTSLFEADGAAKGLNHCNASVRGSSCASYCTRR